MIETLSPTPKILDVLANAQEYLYMHENCDASIEELQGYYFRMLSQDPQMQNMQFEHMRLLDSPFLGVNSNAFAQAMVSNRNDYLERRFGLPTDQASYEEMIAHDDMLQRIAMEGDPKIGLLPLGELINIVGLSAAELYPSD